MSSKRAMKQAQKQAYAKHRSNITSSKFKSLKRNFKKKKKELTFFFKFLNFFTSRNF